MRSCFLLAALSGLVASGASAQAPDTAAPDAAEGAAVEAAPSPGDSAAPGAAAEPTTSTAETADDAAEPEASAAGDAAPVPATPAARPRVAIVLSGDPDEALVAGARTLETALTAADQVTLPSDPAMRDALRGSGMDDGLDDVRASRRRLGRSEEADVPILAELGRLVRAVLVLALRVLPDGGIEVVAFDVGQMAFFDGSVAVDDASSERMATFSFRRARVAAEGAAEARDPVDEPEAAAGAATEESAPNTEDPVLRWFEQNWAYLAAAALLGGAIAFVAVVATDPGTPQPMLRFRPGGTTP